MKLSKKIISSFCGDVIPLRIIEGYKAGEVIWECDNDNVFIRKINSNHEKVILSLLKEGKSIITADYCGEKLKCHIVIEKMFHALPNEKMNYYIGDFHIHTSEDHNHDTFFDNSAKCINDIKEEGVLDFSVISDHADVTDDKFFFNGFENAEAAGQNSLIVFAGAESEVTDIQTDYYGYSHKNSGEIVTVNSDNFAGVKKWSDFESKLKNSLLPIGSFAHPQVIGWDENGIWNFNFEKIKTPFLTRMMRMIEMGNGTPEESNILYEYSYSKALDCGFKVSPCSTSDHHGPIWSSNQSKGKTVIMAPQKSKAAFIDAIINNRVYATESGNVKLFYSINGVCAGDIVNVSSEYKFHVKIGSLNEHIKDKIKCCEVISDYGNKLHTVRNVDFNDFEFTIEAKDAHYFYLRIIDEDGNKTWSAPIWTDRADKFSEKNKGLNRLNKKGFTATDKNGEDAGLLINSNPSEYWTSSDKNDVIIIDMKERYSICAVGFYPRRLLIDEFVDKFELMPFECASFVSNFRISISNDGEVFKTIYSGCLRVFGGEEIFEFNECECKYIKVDLLSTIGAQSGREKFENAKIKLSEIDFFTNSDI